ncbi:MAG: hypothetical protein E6K61_05380 [Nitrospirae bacterium]|nr:MAG: hypothetical protein E6K61_05380 [Nitrospirota bacterium]
MSTLDALDQATPVAWAVTDSSSVLEVQPEPSGGVRATGTLHLPAPPSVVHQAGDFRRYRRTWRLVQDGNEGLTRAEFELLVEVDTWAPDWLMALELRRQLEKHFRILREQVGERLQSH